MSQRTMIVCDVCEKEVHVGIVPEHPYPAIHIVIARHQVDVCHRCAETITLTQLWQKIAAFAKAGAR